MNDLSQPTGASRWQAAQACARVVWSTARQVARRHDWMAFPIGVFVFSRVALVALSAVSMRLMPRLFEYENRRQAFLQQYPALDGLCRWDCGHYVRLAQTGYQYHTDGNLWPLLPMCARSLSWVSGLPVHFSVLLVANLSALMSLVAIYWIFRELRGERAARVGLGLFVAFPFAYYQAAGYPESLMIGLTAMAMALAMTGRHISAGLVLGLAVLARHLSALAGFGLVAIQIAQRGPNLRRLVLSPALLGLLLPLVALAGYAWFLGTALGDPWAFWTSRVEGWGAQAWWGVHTALTSDRFNARHGLYLACSLFPGVGAFALLAQRRTWPLAALGVSLMVVIWLIGAEGLGRYSASCWPGFLVWGAWLSDRPMTRTAVLFGFVLFQGMLAFLFMHQYPLL